MGVSELFNLKQLHGNVFFFFLQNTKKLGWFFLMNSLKVLLIKVIVVVKQLRFLEK